VVADYPVLAELREFGFRWFSVADVDAVRAFLDRPDPGLHDTNGRLAREHFDLTRLPAQVDVLLADLLGAPAAIAAGRNGTLAR
jgi:hypothetical protein